MKERTAAILNKIIISELPVSVERLSEEYDVSFRTIRNDIGEINEYLQEHQLPFVQQKRSQGYFIELTEEETHTIKQLVFEVSLNEYLTREERILDIILDIGLGNQPVFLTQKERKYHVSKSSIDEDMRQIRQKLQSFGIQVVSHPKQGLLFEAKESIIRTILYSLINPELTKNDMQAGTGKMNIVSEYLPENLFGKVNAIFSRTITETGDDLYRRNFILFTIIWIRRVEKKQYVAHESEYIEETNLQEFLEEICRIYRLAVPNQEISYIGYILKSFKMITSDSPSNWGQLQVFILQLIDYVEHKTGIPFTKKENSLQQGLYNHLVSMVARVENDVQLTNPLKDRVKKSYGLIYDAVTEFTERLELMLGKDITEDELAFLTIHFSAVFSEINQENDVWYRAVVICNHGMATGMLLAENLKEFFNIEVIAILSSREISIIDKLDVDLVFSTVDIQYDHKPVLMLDSIIQEDTKIAIHHFLSQHQSARRITNKKQDYTRMFLDILHLIRDQGLEVSREIYTKFESVFSKYALDVNRREVQPMIQDILTDHHISIVSGEYSWQEAIKVVSEPLLSEQIIEPIYINAMIDGVNKYGPYIVIGPHLALAHARPEDGANKLGLSLTIFETPVSFGVEEEQQVQIVFCLSAVDSFSHLNIMKSLVSLIQNEEKIDELGKARDVETVKQILFHSKEEKQWEIKR